MGTSAAKKGRRAAVAPLTRDALWYQNAVIYEVHIRAFCDSNGDGVGDLQGLISKLPYLQDLGVTALWLLPFYPSPLRDGGYDIADYTSINPAYGTMADFRRFLDEAHRRDLRVITELVINHTSIDHAWFQRARRAAPGSAARDFYVWHDSPERYTSARIIFKDFETSNWAWDPLAKAYYWHRFYSHQPDLNFDNPAVHQAVFDVLDFWLGLGVDGLRLDAVPYLYEREGTSCENLPETHAFLRQLRAHVDAKFPQRMLLAEANQWPIDAAAYFGAGDECHMNFHFPLMPRMFMAVQKEDRFPIVDILRQTPTIPAGCQWATFLRNHDELTLEMVTDEDRDYMYHVYSEDPVARINLGIRRRLNPLLRSRRKVELMTALLLSLPGTPVLYYGDEVGMGDNVYLGDRDGVRTPMQWSADRNAGFSRANPQRLFLPVIIDPEYHYEAVNVEAQQANPSSLLWWTKRLIALRRQHPSLATGELEFLHPANPKILAFFRKTDRETILVVANLSRYPQYAELDLSAYAGRIPTEIFGRTSFPEVSDRPYPLAFGPYAFYWFVLQEPGATQERTIPTVEVTGSWLELFGDRRGLARILADHAADRRWFRGKARTRRDAELSDVVQLPTASGQELRLVTLEISYAEGEPETYLIALGFAAGESAAHLEQTAAHGVIAVIEQAGDEPRSRGVLYDALATGEAGAALLAGLLGRLTLQGEVGKLSCSAGKALRERCGELELQPRAMRLDQSNSTIPFGDRVILKVFRQLEPGMNAELELGSFLTDHGPRGLVPRVLGSASHTRPGSAPMVVAVAHELIPNQGTAWDLFVDQIDDLFEKALSATLPAPARPHEHLFDLAAQELPDYLAPLMGTHTRHARQLGQRTAEVHVVLASGTDPAFAPDRFTAMHQQSLFQGARAALVRTCETLRLRQPRLPEDTRATVQRLLDAEAAIEARLRLVTSRLIDATRVRGHGDLHLGQVLFTGDRFVLIDFEGEPARPLRERRYKRCPLRDVAGMIRSFSYLAEHCLRDGRQRPQDIGFLLPWASVWTAHASAAYLAGYREVAEPAGLLPSVPDDRRLLLDFYLLEKGVYEVGYELNNRPGWLDIPVRGLLELVFRVIPGQAGEAE